MNAGPETCPVVVASGIQESMRTEEKMSTAEDAEDAEVTQRRKLLIEARVTNPPECLVVTEFNLG